MPIMIFSPVSNFGDQSLDASFFVRSTKFSFKAEVDKKCVDYISALQLL